MKVPLPNIKYERYNAYFRTSFYIRAYQGNRDYGEAITPHDKRLHLGIYDHKTGHFLEWAYGIKNDQIALMNEVLENMISQKERRKKLKIFLRAIEKALESDCILHWT